MPEGVRFPGESDEYRSARSELLVAEIDLRAQIARVAQLRRSLPLGGVVPRDYRFTEARDVDGTHEVRLSQLFSPGKPSLIVYSYMYSPEMASPCPACTSLVDGFNGCFEHVADRVNFVVLGKSPAGRLAEIARQRGWDRVRLLSSHGTTYNTDYHAEDANGRQLPAVNVFTLRDGVVHHFYATEVLYAGLEGHPRHVDLVWPIWNLFDLTPEGRGTDWHPRLSYATTSSMGPEA